MTDPRQRPLHRDLAGFLAVVALSGPALALSGLLTWLKFRADHLCDDEVLASCGAGSGHGGCAVAFHDGWALVLGLPLTCYAAAFYAVIAALAATALLRPRTLRATIRPLVLLLALAGLMVSLALAAYAGLGLRTWCLYCTVLYVINLGLFVAARLMHPAGVMHGLRALVRPSDTTVVGLVAGLGLVTGVMAQRAVYLRAIAAVESAGLRPCVLQLAELEPVALTVASERPATLVVGLFVDLECAHCRASLAGWREAAAAAGTAELRVYQFPRDVCESTRPGLDTSPRCNASRALLCLTEQAPDPATALARAEAMFALQDGPAADLSNAALAAFARAQGVDADAGREVADDPLFSCMASAATTATLARHVRLARDVAQLDAPPGALLVPLIDGRPGGQAFRVRGRKPAAQLSRWIAAIEADTPTKETR